MPKPQSTQDLEQLPSSKAIEDEIKANIELQSLLERAISVQSKLEKVKELYGEMEEITQELLKMKFKGTVYKGKPIVIVDNFKEKNTCFRTTSVKRFEVKIG